MKDGVHFQKMYPTQIQNAPRGADSSISESIPITSVLILREHIRTGDPLTYERIDKAVHDLYDGWEHMPENAHSMIQSILADEDMDALYEAYAQEESAAKDALLTFDDKYPDVLKEDNLSDILSHLMAKQKEAAESE